MSIQDGNIIHESDFKSIINSDLNTATQMTKKIKFAGRSRTFGETLFSEALNTGSGDNNTVLFPIDKTTEAGSTTAFYDSGNKWYKSTISGALISYDEHTGTTINWTLWQSGITHDSIPSTGGGGNVTQDGWLIISAAHNTGGPGAWAQTVCRTSGVSFPLENNINYIKIIGSMNCSETGAPAYAGTYILFGDVAIGSIIINGNTSIAGSEIVMELFRLSDSTWSLYHDGVFKRSFTPANSLITGSCYVNDGGLPGYGNAVIRINFERYSSGNTYANTLVQTNNVLTIKNSIKALMFSPTISGNGMINYDISTNGGSDWIKKNCSVDKFINFSGTNNGSVLAMKIWLITNGSTWDANQVNLGGYSIEVFS